MKNVDVCFTVVSLAVVSLAVVSLDLIQSKWGIEGDFYAKDKDDAITQAQEQAEKFGAKRLMFYSFLKDSEELNEFIKTHTFID